jgi:hypothetical protein
MSRFISLSSTRRILAMGIKQVELGDVMPS